jgi:glycerol-3-phosphate dehydrogenase
MAEDVIDRAVASCGLARRSSQTAELRLHGWSLQPPATNEWEGIYGADLPELRKLTRQSPELAEPIHPNLPFRKSEVVWAARYEMARTIEDVLARRTRALFLDARKALECAPAVASLMKQELNRDTHWESDQIAAFTSIAEQYVWNE